MFDGEQPVLLEFLAPPIGVPAQALGHDVGGSLGPGEPMVVREKQERGPAVHEVGKRHRHLLVDREAHLATECRDAWAEWLQPTGILIAELQQHVGL